MQAVSNENGMLVSKLIKYANEEASKMTQAAVLFEEVRMAAAKASGMTSDRKERHPTNQSTGGIVESRCARADNVASWRVADVIARCVIFNANTFVFSCLTSLAQPTARDATRDASRRRLCDAPMSRIAAK